METLTPEILNLGALAIIVLFTIKEAFSYFKSRDNKRVSEGHNQVDKATLAELKLMNENHLTTICRVIGEGNKENVKAISDMNVNLGNKLDVISDGISRLIGRSDK